MQSGEMQFGEMPHTHFILELQGAELNNHIKETKIEYSIKNDRVKGCKKKEKNFTYLVVEVLKNTYHEEEINEVLKALQKVRKYEG
ncbi:hypothetical protein H8356DRAFT_1361095 [Neocallimastix lanati (nom. inval.)]|nr:hypothetical protein H8356DRAFT_1361095 [Neocallimastix sp. JGI-2020a]